MSKLLFGITKIVPQRAAEQFTSGERSLAELMFAEAYEELRRSVPRGDLIIRLQVEADSPEEVGAVLEER